MRSPSLNAMFSRYPVMRAFTSTRWIASTRPTKSRVLVTGFDWPRRPRQEWLPAAAPSEHRPEMKFPTPPTISKPAYASLLLLELPPTTSRLVHVFDASDLSWITVRLFIGPCSIDDVIAAIDVNRVACHQLGTVEREESNRLSDIVHPHQATRRSLALRFRSARWRGTGCCVGRITSQNKTPRCVASIMYSKAEPKRPKSVLPDTC